MENKVQRFIERARYDSESLFEILDSSPYCIISFCEKGFPYAIPMNFARLGDHLYIHGHRDSRIIKHLASGNNAAVNITIVGNVVISEKLCNYSIKYRSAVIFGKFEEFVDRPEKLAFFKAMGEKLNPGKIANSILPDEKDLDNVTVLKIKLENFSIKIND